MCFYVNVAVFEIGELIQGRARRSLTPSWALLQAGIQARPASRQKGSFFSRTYLIRKRSHRRDSGKVLGKG